MQGGATPLFVASQQGRQEVVCRLSDAGADKDIAMQGATSLLIAPESGHHEVVRPRCDDQGGGITLICDVRVGPCIREETDHLEVSTLTCDEQGSGTTLHCDAMSLSAPVSGSRQTTSRCLC